MPQAYGISYATSLPGIAADGAQKQARTDQYGAQHVIDRIHAWAEDGTYFRNVGNATPLTGTAQAITTAFSATAVPLVMVNGSSTKKVIPHYIKLTNTAAGASTTSSAYAISIDSANRYSSGGTDISSLIYCANSALGPTSGLSALRIGTVTASAAGAGTRYISAGQLKVQAAPCWIVGDELIFFFGDPGSSGAMGLISGGAAARYMIPVGPAVLGGQDDSLILHLWNVANATTAPSWAFEIAWWER
jgi:hypothetical protein